MLDVGCSFLCFPLTVHEAQIKILQRLFVLPDAFDRDAG